jgi:hypothetical protein
VQICKPDFSWLMFQIREILPYLKTLGEAHYHLLPRTTQGFWLTLAGPAVSNLTLSCTLPFTFIHQACKVVLATTPYLNVWWCGREDLCILNIVDGSDWLASHSAALSRSGIIFLPTEERHEHSWADGVLVWSKNWCLCLESEFYDWSHNKSHYKLSCPGL